jgi:predicted hydrocarbon binding protein
MPGTVNAIVPLSLLEAVRSVDIPEGEDVDVEYVQEHRNKRLGLSDTVIAQIRRYKEAMKRNQQIPIDEAIGIARLIGRRSDAEGIFVRAGKIVADRIYETISATFRQVKKAGEKYFGASVRRVGASIVFGVKESVTYEAAPRAIGCLYYESALREMLKLLVNGGGMIDHVRCREKGEDICEWRAEWRAVKTSQ